MADKFLTIEQAAERLGVARATIYQLVKKGKLEVVRSEIGTGKGGRRVFVRASDVDELGKGIIRAKE